MSVITDHLCSRRGVETTQGRGGNFTIFEHQQKNIAYGFE